MKTTNSRDGVFNREGREGARRKGGTGGLAVALALAVAGMLSGCGEAHGEGAHEHVEPAAVYKEGHGIRFTDTAVGFAGLETAEAAVRDDATVAPEEAVLRTVRGDFVYVANGEWLLRTPVTTGARHGADVEIADGLYEGDVLVVKGVRALALAEIQALNGGVGCADGH